MVLQQDWENTKWMKVNLSIPKFDVNSTINLKDGLQEMGVTDVFSELTSNFNEITGDVPIYLTAANQSVRVQIDEEGVKAAAYIEFPGAGSPMPPEEIIDFILDRPFLFVISNDNIPLFAGVVNEP
jgi:serine protease inhibitor